MTIDVTTDTFQTQVIESTVPVLVDFHADWCMPCRMLEPVLAELARDYGDRATVARVDVDDQGELAARYEIISIPALLLFKNGTVVEQQVGAAPRETIAEMIDRHLD